MIFGLLNFWYRFQAPHDLEPKTKLPCACMIVCASMPTYSRYSKHFKGTLCLETFEGQMWPGSTRYAVGPLRLFLGSLEIFSGSVAPFWGSVELFWGSVELFVGVCRAFFGVHRDP